MQNLRLVLRQQLFVPKSLIKTLVFGTGNFQYPVVLFGCKVIVKIIHRVNWHAPSVYLIMAVGAGAFAGGAYITNYLASLYHLASPSNYPVHVAI